MRVVHVAHRYYPPDIGGVSLHVHSLAREQAALGHTVYVVTNAEPGYPQFERNGKIVVFRCRAVGERSQNPFNLKVIAVLSGIRLTGQDVVHCHSHLFFTSLFASLYARAKQIPLVVTVHGFELPRGPIFNLLLLLYVRTIGHFVLRCAKQIICLNPAVLNKIRQLGFDHAVLIPHGVNLNRFRPRKGKRSNNFVWVGRYVPEKGVQLLLQSASKVRLRHPSVKFTLIGPTVGPEFAKVNKLRKSLGLEQNVDFVGALTPNDVARELCRATAFVLPSKSEGGPLTVLEAMASGTPVIAPIGIGLDDIIDRAGFMFAGGSSDDLAQVLSRVLSDRETLRSVGRRGRDLARAYFGWRGIAERTVRTYETLIQSPPPIADGVRQKTKRSACNSTTHTPGKLR